MNIHPVRHDKTDKNQYCGPSAISILTGMSTGEAARLIRHVTGKKQVQGTSTWAIRRSLLMCGLRSQPHYVPTTTKFVERKGSLIRGGGTYVKTSGELTLAQWLKQTVDIRSAGRVFLVVARNHWQVISGRRYCCGQTGKIISVRDKGCKRRARVTEVYEITSASKIVIPPAARKPKAVTRVDPSRRKLEALLKQHGIPKGKVVLDGGYKDYVIPPCDHFRLGCSTIHYDWSETYYRIEDAIAHPITVAENDGHWSE